MNASRISLLGLSVLLLVAAEGPRAQVSLPVQVPNLPRVETPVDLGRTVDRVTDQLDPSALRELRLQRVRALIRTHRDVIEADPDGEPIRRSEILAFSPGESALDAARAAGFTVLRTTELEGLDERVIALHAPPKLSTRRALKRLREIDPGGTYDYNHIYVESGAVSDAVSPKPSSSGPAATQAPVRVGLIDGGIDSAHPAFRSSPVTFHGCAGRRVPSAHGTAVASLIVGQADGFKGAAASYTLYLADVYCGEPTGGAVDAVVGALAWMAREHVPVVNISLVGPANAMLERVTRTVLARGHVLVAAVGNDGPAARPLYPAAYSGVIGVTGVDARQRVLVEACRGAHVDLAAPGADMAAAALTTPYTVVRGTSFAAPIVAGLLARRLPAPDATGAAAALQELTSSAIDLGARGRDKTYGAGLVGESVRVDPRLVGVPVLSQRDK